MGQKINLLIITILAITISIVSFVFAVNYRKESVSYFYNSGYIISNLYDEGLDNVNKLYFETDASYKKADKDTYTFTNSEGERVNVSHENFVHYSDGAIMSLKKGVAIDLNDIDSKLISYYNIFEGSVLTKKNEVYEIENLNDTISFSKLLFKISNNKYLIGFPKILISFEDDQTVYIENYAEIEYVNENVIRIYNDKVNYQTIASDLYLLIDDVKMDLEYKTISKNNVDYLTMADMVINSDDNIEILPKKPELVVPEENNNSNNNINNGGGNNNQGNNTGEVIDPDLQEGLDNLITNIPEGGMEEEKEEVVQPKFKVDSMDVTTLGFENLLLSFEDESSILYGNRSVQILENSTGKVVATLDEWEEGVLNYAINSYLSLKPNSAYTLNVVGQYKIDETVYDRTFISKIFRTLDIGLNVLDDYKTDTTLSFLVYKNSYSNVNSFKYNIKDKEGKIIVDDTRVEFNGNEKIIITENEKFIPNTEYIFTIKDIQYGNDIFATVSYQELQLAYETKTLKQNPFKKIEEVVLKGTVDSRENTVLFSVDGLNDINGGIVSYTYNVFDNNAAAEETANNADIIKTIVKNDSTPLKLTFEDLGATVGENNNVYFNVLINFDDNEKTIIYSSGNSQPISLTGTPYPMVVDYIKDSTNKNSEILKGAISIDDSHNFIQINNISRYKIDIKENVNSSLGGTGQYVRTVEVEMNNDGTTTYDLPVYFEGLKPNTEYILYVYLFHNNKYIYLGYDIATSEMPQPIKLDVIYSENNVDDVNLFNFNVKRTVDNEENPSFDNLKSIKFELYRKSSANTSEDAVWSKTNFSTTIPKDQDNISDLMNLVYSGAEIEVAATDFNFYVDNYENIYDYKIVVTGFARGYEIPVIINNSDVNSNEFDVVFNDIAPSLSLKVQEISNDDVDTKYKDNNLNGETTVGVKVEIITKANPMGEKINKIFYKIYEAKSYDEKTGECEKEGEPLRAREISLISSSDLEREEIFNSTDSKLYRGKPYCIEYSGIYGENKETKSENLYFKTLKQRIDITGYIKSYDGNDISFKLNITDPDKALIDDSITLVSNEETIGAIKNDNEYTFKKISGKNYNLRIKEDIGEGIVEQNIYEARLDEILNLEKTKIVVDTRNPGKIMFKIPYGECDELDVDTCITNNLNTDRISALGIKNDNNNIDVLKLEHSDGFLYSEVNLNDIYKYGVVEGNIFTPNDLYILYDSGKILENNQFFFIKSKFIEDNGIGHNYFDKSKGSFQLISSNSVFNVSDLVYDNNFNIYNINNTNSILKFNKFNSAKSNSSIGILLENTEENKILRTIEYNEIAKSETQLYDIANQEKSSFEIRMVVSTSKIKTTHTSTGANVSFDLIETSITGETTLKINLFDSNNQIVDNATINCTYSNNSCIWSEHVDESKKISKIVVNYSKVDISFNNIDDSENYKYSIEFSIDNQNYQTTYNIATMGYNDNIIISSLKNLDINDYYAKLESKYWSWSDLENKKDFVFKKIIAYSFNVNKNYSLEDNEKISYRILARNKEDNTKSNYILGDDETFVDLSSNPVVGEVNLYEKILDEGTYEIILQTQLTGDKNINFNDFVLNGELKISMEDPSFDVIKTANSVFQFTVDDKNGVLTSCPKPEGESIGSIDNIDAKNYQGEQVVYFQLYKKNEEKDEYIGYVPVPFILKTSVIDLSEIFEKKLSTGQYRVGVSYCRNNESKSKIFSEVFDIYNEKNLKIDLIDMLDRYYTLVFIDPDNIIDNIKRIKYQYTTVNNSTYLGELSNLDDDINPYNNIVFTSYKDGDTKISFLGLSLESYTTQVTSLEIDFYDESGKIIKHFSK